MSTLQRLRERFWFIPALLCLAAFGLAEGLVTLDERLGSLAVPGWAGALLYRVGASGSRDVLGAIASSSLAVAGTTFSITMAVLALTSSTYGPRLIRNFMSDRGNQVVLGVLVATFLYSLLVLRSIRVIGGTAGPGVADADTFVPHLAVNAAMLLAVADVVVLIYFIHHISDSIQISTLTAGVRNDLRATIERVYHATGDRERPGGAEEDPEPPIGGIPLRAPRSGYLQSVEEDELVQRAARHGVVVVLEVRTGQYVVEGAVLARVLPADRASESVLHTVGARLHLADARTPHQDPEFAVQQLTEMAVRALSPGTNDPYTAVNALDDLSSGLSLLAGRPCPSGIRRDTEGSIRLHARRTHPVDLITAVIDRMRWYATSAPSVMHATLELLERVAPELQSPADRARLASHVGLLVDAFESAGHQTHDVAVFTDRARALQACLAL